MPGYPRPRSATPIPLAELATLLHTAVVLPVRADDAVRTDVAAGATARVPATVAVTGVTHASASVRPGDLYAALPGARRHGAEFVAAAAASGAVAVLTDPAGAAAAAAAGLPALVVADPRAVLGEVASRVYGDPTRHLTVIGLTGTAGKTSTAYLVESGLRAAGRITGLIGTVETRLGGLVVDSARTTPEATDLHAALAAAAERGVDSVAIEVSSHALALGRVGGVSFAVGGFTNFGLDHLDFHPGVEEYFQAKARLFDGRCAVEVVNLDDAAGRRLLRPGSVTYSAAGDPAATWRAVDVSGTGYAQKFTALGPDGVSVAASVSLPGRHNVANALLAIAALVAVGIEPGLAAAGVGACPGVPGRLERLDAPGPVLGVVDYAHKPDSIVAALAALREVTRTRLICVLGAGGDRDRGKRPLMGAAGARGADLLIVTDDNPRTEEPAAIRAEVLTGAWDAARLAASAEVASGGAAPGAAGVGIAEVMEVAGRRAAIDEAVRRAGPADVIALLGKGHESGQEIADVISPFDDRVQLTEALAARFGGATGGAGPQ